MTEMAAAAAPLLATVVDADGRDVAVDKTDVSADDTPAETVGTGIEEIP